MKFLLFAAGALAATVSKRQDSLGSDITAIQTATESLTEAISGYSGVGSAPGIISASEGVQSAIQTAIDTVAGIDTLDAIAAAGLIEPTQNLQTAVTAAIDAVIAQQEALAADGLDGETLNQLTAIQSLAQTFADDVVAKVPENLSGTAQGLVDPILADLQRGVDAFQGAGDGGSAEPTADPTAEPTPEPTASEGLPTDTYATATATGSSTGSALPPPYTVKPTVTGNGTTPPPAATYTGAASNLGASFGMVAAGLAVLAF